MSFESKPAVKLIDEILRLADLAEEDIKRGLQTGDLKSRTKKCLKRIIKFDTAILERFWDSESKLKPLFIKIKELSKQAIQDIDSFNHWEKAKNTLEEIKKISKILQQFRNDIGAFPIYERLRISDTLNLLTGFFTMPLLKYDRKIRSKRIIEFLIYLDDEFHPENIYYPGAGYDHIPKKVFGKERVVHLCNDFRYILLAHSLFHIFNPNYMKYDLGDFRKTHYKDNFFDMTYVDEPLAEAADDIIRVTKKKGIIVGTRKNIPIYEALKRKGLREIDVSKAFPEFYIFINTK